MQRYMKRPEAKVHTSWMDPNPDYEAQCRFTERVLGDQGFREDLQGFTAPLIEPGRINSLSQTLLKLTTPGVPDIYQGAELWTDSLVDPDNRRPVDYELRTRLLGALRDDTPVEAILSQMEAGLPKLWVVRQARTRRRLPDCFGKDPGVPASEVRGQRSSACSGVFTRIGPAS
jgi:(1->4)-alpha-D-glucan 1-alpha-D-glucosylmutase